MMTADQFSEHYQRHFRSTQKFLLSRGCSATEAEEFAQGAWAKAWEHLEGLRGDAAISSWVNRIALNLFIGYQRLASVKRCEPLMDGHFRIGAIKLDADSAIHARRMIQKLRRRLTDRERTMLAARYQDGLNTAEMALRFGRGEPTIKTVLYRAVHRARRIAA